MHITPRQGRVDQSGLNSENTFLVWWQHKTESLCAMHANSDNDNTVAHRLRLDGEGPALTLTTAAWSISLLVSYAGLMGVQGEPPIFLRLMWPVAESRPTDTKWADCRCNVFGHRSGTGLLEEGRGRHERTTLIRILRRYSHTTIHRPWCCETYAYWVHPNQKDIIET